MLLFLLCNVDIAIVVMSMLHLHPTMIRTCVPVGDGTARTCGLVGDGTARTCVPVGDGTARTCVPVGDGTAHTWADITCLSIISATTPRPQTKQLTYGALIVHPIIRL